MRRGFSKGNEYKQQPLGMRLRDTIMKAFVDVIRTPMPQWWLEEFIELSNDIETMAASHQTQAATIKSMKSHLHMLKMQVEVAGLSPQKVKGEMKPAEAENAPPRTCKYCRTQIKHTNFFFKGLCFICTPEGLQMERYREWQKREARLASVSNK